MRGRRSFGTLSRSPGMQWIKRLLRRAMHQRQPPTQNVCIEFSSLGNFGGLPLALHGLARGQQVVGHALQSWPDARRQRLLDRRTMLLAQLPELLCDLLLLLHCVEPSQTEAAALKEPG